MYISTSNQAATTTIPGLGLVTPPDSRELVRDTRVVPYRWICALDLFYPWRGGEQRNRGTGFLVSPRHVLTAAHNVRPAVGVDARRITVTPAMDGTSLLNKPHGPVGSVTLTPKDWWAPPEFKNPTRDHTWDFALLTLPKEFPAFRAMPYGYWGAKHFEPATQFTHPAAAGLQPVVHVAGYPSDKCRDKDCAPCAGSPVDYDPVRDKANWASMQWTSAGAVRPAAPTGLLLYDADTCAGMSGGPVWQLTKQPDGKWTMTLVAIHGGTYTRPDPMTKVDETLNRGLFLGTKSVQDLLRDRMRRDGVRPLF